MKSILLLLLSLVLFSGRTQAQKIKVKQVNTDYEHGTLTNGRPTGVWQYFDHQHHLSLAFNYDSSRIVFVSPDTARYRLRAGDDWRYARPSRAPRFLGSPAALMRHLGTSLRYPADALMAGQQGTVVVEFTVGSEGLARDYAVVQSVSETCDAEVLRVLRSIPNQWLPAVHLGRPADARFRAVVHFTVAAPGETGEQVARRISAHSYGRSEYEFTVTGYRGRP